MDTRETPDGPGTPDGSAATEQLPAAGDAPASTPEPNGRSSDRRTLWMTAGAIAIAVLCFAGGAGTVLGVQAAVGFANTLAHRVAVMDGRGELPGHRLAPGWGDRLPDHVREHLRERLQPDRTPGTQAPETPATPGATTG